MGLIQECGAGAGEPRDAAAILRAAARDCGELARRRGLALQRAVHSQAAQLREGGLQVPICQSEFM
jgi:hypothetical protein